MQKYIVLKETTHKNKLVKAGGVISSDVDLEKLNPIAFISEGNKAQKDAEAAAKAAAEKTDAEKLKDALEANKALEAKVQKLTQAAANGAKTATEPKATAKGKGKGGKEPEAPEAGTGKQAVG